MAVEPKRGCGYRKVGGIYLMGTGIAVRCMRLPMHLPQCPVCGFTIEFYRGIRKINPKQLFGDCDKRKEQCCGRDCYVCYPPEKGWLMWVGAQFYPTPEDFIMEANRLGVSKRIPFVPEDLQIGDKVYLAHPKVFREKSKETGKLKWVPGLFYAFVVTDIEAVIPESKKSDEEYLQKYREKGVTSFFPVPDDDPDHRGSVYKVTKEKKSNGKVRSLTEYGIGGGE